MSAKWKKILFYGSLNTGRKSIARKIINNVYALSKEHTSNEKITLKDGRSLSGTIIISEDPKYHNIKHILKADYVFLVVDLTNKESFEPIKEYLQTVKEKSLRTQPVVICFNKCDLTEEYQININEAKRFVENLGFTYYLTSAQTGEGIEEAKERMFMNV